MEQVSPRPYSYSGVMRPLVSDVDPTISSIGLDDMTRDSTMYKEHPGMKPFINSEFVTYVQQPRKAPPEGSRDAIEEALQAIQKKIRQMEIEKQEAGKKLEDLTTGTSRLRDSLQQSGLSEPVQDIPSQPPPPVTQLPAQDFTNSNKDIEGKLHGTETKCNLLEKQLEYMRKMLHDSEQRRKETLARITISQRHEDEEVLDQQNKLKMMEQEMLKLTATQTLAQSKIRDLEERLQTEQHHRRLMQDKAAQLETAAETQRILMQSTGKPKSVPVRKVAKKKVRSKSAGNVKLPGHGREPPEHYRLNLGDLPFVAGKSTKPSHSLPATMQGVLSMMKQHNPRLCTSPRQHFRPTSGFAGTMTSSSSGVSSQEDLQDTLMQLQDEFKQLTREHEELARQIQGALDDRLREDLEREQDDVVSQMQKKSRQIECLRKHAAPSKKKKKKGKKATKQQTAVTSVPSNGEVQVTTTIRRSKDKAQASSGHFHPGAAQASLRLLHDLKKIQTQLTKHDISWDEQ